MRFLVILNKFKLINLTRRAYVSSLARPNCMLLRNLPMNMFFISRRNNMDEIFLKFDKRWSESIVSDKRPNAVAFHKARLDATLYQDMLDYMKEEFYNSKQNVFEMHLFLIQKCLDNKDSQFKQASMFFVNQAFIDYYNQLKNVCKKSMATGENAKIEKHFTINCKDQEQICFCTKNEEIVLKAFNLVVERRCLNLLSSFNKIYNFIEHLDHLKPHIINHMNNLKCVDQAILLGELQIQQNFSLDEVIILFFQVISAQTASNSLKRLSYR